MDASFWLDRWATDRIGFHRAEANPNLLKWWPHLELTENERVLVPLCGKTLDLHWLGARHSTVGVELAAHAVDAFWSESGQTPTRNRQPPFESSQAGDVSILCGDFMALEHAHVGPIGGFYDRAAFIALPPDLRREYVKTLTRILEPGTRGLVVTIDYEPATAGGPPFSISPDMLSTQLGSAFAVELLESRAAPIPGGLSQRGVTVLNEHVFAVTRG